MWLSVGEQLWVSLVFEHIYHMKNHPSEINMYKHNFFLWGTGCFSWHNCVYINKGKVNNLHKQLTWFLFYRKIKYSPKYALKVSLNGVWLRPVFLAPLYVHHNTFQYELYNQYIILHQFAYGIPKSSLLTLYFIFHLHYKCKNADPCC